MKRLCTEFFFSFFCASESEVVGNKLRQWETRLALKTAMNKQIQTNKPWKNRDYWATLGVAQSLQQHECVIKPADVLGIFNSILLLDETKPGNWWQMLSFSFKLIYMRYCLLERPLFFLHVSNVCILLTQQNRILQVSCEEDLNYLNLWS